MLMRMQASNPYTTLSCHVGCVNMWTESVAKVSCESVAKVSYVDRECGKGRMSHAPDTRAEKHL